MLIEKMEVLPVESTNLKDITVNSISLNDNISAYEDKLVEEKDI